MIPEKSILESEVYDKEKNRLYVFHDTAKEPSVVIT